MKAIMNSTEGYYQQHIFFCLNQKDSGRKCCAAANAETMWAHAKERLQTLGFEKRCVRVNKSGCLGRCSEGPVLVVYPEGIWYTYQTQADIDEIIDQHLVGHKPVERLLLQVPAS